jgi:hypothetical protein
MKTDIVSLEYEFQRRNEERELMLKAITRQYTLIGLAIFVLLTFVTFLLALDKDAIAIEILKASAFMLAGGGIAWRLPRGSDKQSKE